MSEKSPKIKEGQIYKGGKNEAPSSDRPTKPEGQGGSSAASQQSNNSEDPD